MKNIVSAHFEKRSKADLLVVPFTLNHGKIEWPLALKKRSFECEAPILAGDFKAKEGEVLAVYPSKQPELRFLLLGLGEQENITSEKLRRSYASAVKAALKLKAKSVNILVPELKFLPDEELLRGVAEGVFLTNYVFDKLKVDSIKKEPTVLLKECCWITPSKKAIAIIDRAYVICESVKSARDLVNDNADDISPQFFADFASNMSKRERAIKVTLLDKKKLEKEKMGLLLAVSRGSSCDPYLILAEYQGNPKSKEKILLVGKGVTYDTGGLNLKPTGSMETMKCDMGGAAAVLSTIECAAKLKLKVNLVAAVPVTENSIGSKSYKPGDVYRSYAGKSVEIGNTDAEGRLILADAMAYGIDKFKPTQVIDIATLTGAIEIALGNECSGLFSNNDAIADGLIRAGSATFERVWRMPLHEEYRDLLRSDIADIKNHGGRAGGAITAAHFLHDFVGKTPWAHLDIAGTAYLNDAKRYHPRYGTGVGVRLLLEYLDGVS